MARIEGAVQDADSRRRFKTQLQDAVSRRRIQERPTVCRRFRRRREVKSEERRKKKTRQKSEVLCRVIYLKYFIMAEPRGNHATYRTRLNMHVVELE